MATSFNVDCPTTLFGSYIEKHAAAVELPVTAADASPIQTKAELAFSDSDYSETGSDAGTFSRESSVSLTAADDQDARFESEALPVAYATGEQLVLDPGYGNVLDNEECFRSLVKKVLLVDLRALDKVVFSGSLADLRGIVTEDLVDMVRRIGTGASQLPEGQDALDAALRNLGIPEWEAWDFLNRYERVQYCVLHHGHRLESESAALTSVAVPAIGDLKWTAEASPCASRASSLEPTGSEAWSSLSNTVNLHAVQQPTLYAALFAPGIDEEKPSQATTKKGRARMAQKKKEAARTPHRHRVETRPAPRSVDSGRFRLSPVLPSEDYHPSPDRSRVVPLAPRTRYEQEWEDCSREDSLSREAELRKNLKGTKRGREIEEEDKDRWERDSRDAIDIGIRKRRRFDVSRKEEAEGLYVKAGVLARRRFDDACDEALLRVHHEWWKTVLPVYGKSWTSGCPYTDCNDAMAGERWDA